MTVLDTIGAMLEENMSATRTIFMYCIVSARKKNLFTHCEINVQRLNLETLRSL